MASKTERLLKTQDGNHRNTVYRPDFRLAVLFKFLSNILTLYFTVIFGCFKELVCFICAQS